MTPFRLFKKESEATAQPGRFIAIDGPDGCGKTTQIELLAQTLAVTGYDGVIFDFPQYNTASSAMLEKYLKGQYGDLNPEAASILYAIDRFDAASKIKAYLAEGKIVLANRYVTSNAGHQGAKLEEYNDRVRFYRWLDNLEYNIFNLPRPDLTILLHMPVEISIQLLEKRAQEQPHRPKDVHESNEEHLRAAEQAFLEIADLYPNTKLVDCFENNQLLSPQETHTKVWELVRRIALKDVPPKIQP